MIGRRRRWPEFRLLVARIQATGTYSYRVSFKNLFTGMNSDESR